MQILNCLHAAVLVSNLDRAEQFYSQVLGLEKVDRILKYPGIWYQVGNFQIHLIVDSNFQSELQNSEKLGRNRHVAFAVADLAAAKEKLIASGYSVQMSASGRAALFTQDPDGNVIEMSEA